MSLTVLLVLAFGTVHHLNPLLERAPLLHRLWQFIIRNHMHVDDPKRLQFHVEDFNAVHLLRRAREELDDRLDDGVAPRVIHSPSIANSLIDANQRIPMVLHPD